MNYAEALKTLKIYETVKGKTIRHKATGKTMNVNVVVIAPYMMSEFLANFQNWIDNNTGMSFAHPEVNYDLYFFDKPYGSPTATLRLKDFKLDYEIA